MPFKPAPEDSTVFYESPAVTIIPAGDHYAYYYEGLWNDDVQFQKIDLQNALMLQQVGHKNNGDMISFHSSIFKKEGSGYRRTRSSYSFIQFSSFSVKEACSILVK